MEEKALIRKLLRTGHLNVPERRWLPEGKAKSRMMCEVFEELLDNGDWFHAWWMPEDSMFGCKIEYRGDGPGRILRRYSGMDGEKCGVETYPSTADAAEGLVMELKELIGDRLDGVPVLWSA